MSSAFTVLWNKERVMLAQRHGLTERPIEFLFGGPHTSQPSLKRAGIGISDVVYPISVRDRHIHVHAQVTVSVVQSIEEFIASHPDVCPPHRRGRWPMETLELAVRAHPWLRALCWTCSDHVVLAERSSPFLPSLVLPRPFLEQLTYRSKKAERPLKGVLNGELHSITGVQGVYRLAESSARDFAILFPA